MATQPTITGTVTPNAGQLPPPPDNDPYPLSQEDRARLLGIVQQMQSDGQDPGNILTAVRTFKQKYSSTGTPKALGDIQRMMKVDVGEALPKSNGPLSTDDLQPAQPIIPVQRALEVGSEPGLAPKAEAASMLLRGAGQAISPIAIPAGLISAPAATVVGLAGGTAAGGATKAALEDSDIPQGYKDLAEDAAGLAGGVAAGGATAKSSDYIEETIAPIVKAVLNHPKLKAAAMDVLPKGKEIRTLTSIVSDVADDVRARQAQAALDASAAAHRAANSPRDYDPTYTSAAPVEDHSPLTEDEMDAIRRNIADKIAARQQTATPRTSLADRNGITGGAPPVAGPVEPISPSGLPSGKRVPTAEERAARASTETAEPSPAATPNVALLDSVAKGQTGKLFKNLTGPQQEIVKKLAAQVTEPSASPARAPTTGETTGEKGGENPSPAKPTTPAETIAAKKQASQEPTINPEHIAKIKEALDAAGASAKDLEEPQYANFIKKSLGIDQPTLDAIQDHLSESEIHAKDATPVGKRGPSPSGQQGGANSEPQVRNRSSVTDKGANLLEKKGWTAADLKDDAEWEKAKNLIQENGPSVSNATGGKSGKGPTAEDYRPSDDTRDALIARMEENQRLGKAAPSQFKAKQYAAVDADLETQLKASLAKRYKATEPPPKIPDDPQTYFKVKPSQANDAGLDDQGKPFGKSSSNATKQKLAELQQILSKKDGAEKVGPVLLREEPDGSLTVEDGHNRLEAARRAGNVEVRAQLLRPHEEAPAEPVKTPSQETKADAVNLKGPTDNAVRQKIRDAFKRGPGGDMGQMPDIRRQVGVSPETFDREILAMQKDGELELHEYAGSPTKYEAQMVKDSGKTYNLGYLKKR